MGWLGNANLVGAAALLAIAAQGVVFFRWIRRRMINDALQRAFVQDLATNHLPHVYYALRLLAEYQGIELGEPPPVQFLHVNGGV